MARSGRWLMVVVLLLGVGGCGYFSSTPSNTAPSPTSAPESTKPDPRTTDPRSAQ